MSTFVGRLVTNIINSLTLWKDYDITNNFHHVGSFYRFVRDFGNVHRTGTVEEPPVTCGQQSTVFSFVDNL